MEIFIGLIPMQACNKPSEGWFHWTNSTEKNKYLLPKRISNKILPHATLFCLLTDI